MLKIAICEDETAQNDLMKSYVMKETEGKEGCLVYQYSCGEDLLKNMHENFSVIFLDIQMGGIDGIETARRIREIDDQVLLIFTTGLNDQWDKGFEVKAFRYLVKPIVHEQFQTHFASVLEELKSKNRRLLIQSKYKTAYAAMEDIIYLEIEGRSVAIQTISDRYVVSDKLSHWEEKLAVYGFAKPHNSFLVNLKHVKYFCKEYVLVEQGAKIQVSQRKYKEFKDSMLSHAGGLV